MLADGAGLRTVRRDWAALGFIYGAMLGLAVAGAGLAVAGAGLAVGSVPCVSLGCLDALVGGFCLVIHLRRQRE